MGKATKTRWIYEGLSFFFAVVATIIVVVVLFSASSYVSIESFFAGKRYQ